MNRENNAKDFAIDKVKEILNIIQDLKYARSMYLIHQGSEEIERLSKGILEHLEYLDLNPDLLDKGEEE